MDFAKILGQLREELKNVEAAIQTLERLQQSTRRRARPSPESALPGQQESPPPKSAPSSRTSANRRPRRSDSNTT